MVKFEVEKVMNIRSQVKQVTKKIVLLFVYPIYLLLELLSIIGNKDRTFQGFAQALSLVPGILGIYVRAAFYHLACPSTSDEILVGFMTILSHRDTTIEKGVYIGPQCNIGKCHIKENTLLGSGVHILSGNKQHSFEDLDTPIQEQGGNYTKIIIGEDCWLGNLSIVMADIGEQSIIAAGSVVIRPIDKKTIVAGNPAKLIRNR